MELDILKYSQAFDKFLLNMTNVRDPFAPEFQHLFEEICTLLHIAKIEADFYDNPHLEQIGKGSTITIYKRQESQNAPLVQKDISSNGNVSIYKLYPETNSWSEQEKAKAQVFITMLITFNTNAKLLNFANRVTFYDQELQLPNMAFFKKNAGELLREGNLESYVISFFNLKHFGNINQRIGRKTANEVIIKFIGQLQDYLDRDGLVCRIGGDNFILMSKKDKMDYVIKYLQGTSIVFDEKTNESIFITANAGYTTVSENDRDLDIIIDKAHTAVITAKKTPGKPFVFYNDQLRIKREQTTLVENMFREAIEKEEFLVYYQPKVMLKDYKLAGAEALCRWVHDGKMIRPDEFIPILEQSNAICTLDFYMLEHVCRDIQRWIHNKQNVVPISVNLSRRHMGDADLLERIMTIIDNYEVPHNLIEIELTETTTDVQFNDLKSITGGLSNQGIHTSVDDFGIGYSSLNLIRQVDWDVIKIDKSFLPKSESSNKTQYTMLKHLFSMLQDMGLKCIVEGVETVDQVKMLKENNCYLAQGFYFDKPLSVQEFEERLAALG